MAHTPLFAITSNVLSWSTLTSKTKSSICSGRRIANALTSIVFATVWRHFGVSRCLRTQKRCWPCRGAKTIQQHRVDDESLNKKKKPNTSELHLHVVLRDYECRGANGCDDERRTSRHGDRGPSTTRTPMKTSVQRATYDAYARVYGIETYTHKRFVGKHVTNLLRANRLQSRWRGRHGRLQTGSRPREQRSFPAVTS